MAFGVLGAVLRFHFGMTVAPWVVWVLGLAAGVVGVAAPLHVYPLYLLVTVLAIPIGFVVSTLGLGLFYYGIMTPLGFVLRLTGRDPMRLRKPSGDSYWLDRGDEPSAGSYYRQS